jgi:hypothetical protein
MKEMSLYDKILKILLNKIDVVYVKLDYKGNIIFDNSNKSIITQGALFDLSGLIYFENDLKILDKFIKYTFKNEYQIINNRKCIHTEYIEKFKNTL